MKFLLSTISVLFIGATVLVGCNEQHSNLSGSEASATGDMHSTHDDHGDDDADSHDDLDSDFIELEHTTAIEAGIRTVLVTRGSIGQSLSLPAEIRFDADRVANVSPKVSGIVGELYASEGDLVAHGDRLALIESRELAGLKAAWLTSEARESLARQAVIREEKLYADKITSQADLQAARAEYQGAKAESDAAENELHAAGVSHDALEQIPNAKDGDNANSYLTAPIAGTVVRRTITLGETVSAGDAGAEPLFAIADDRVVWADIAVYKQDLGKITVGTPVELKSDQGEILAKSNIAIILPLIDETSRTATARVIVENPNGRLLPGQFVTTDLSVGESSSVLLVPDAAVQRVENRCLLYTSPSPRDQRGSRMPSSA